MKKSSGILLPAYLAFAVIAGAQSKPVPVESADKSSALNPPTPIEPGMKGYGTRQVEGKTLPAMLAHCKDEAASLSHVEAARCDQLHRMMTAQPNKRGGEGTPMSDSREK